MNLIHLIATIILSLTLGTNAFSYKEAKNWGKKYSKCNGKNQSPMTVDENWPKKIPDCKKTLRLTNFDELPKKLTIRNTGHTVEMKAEWPDETPMITGGPLHGKYVFEKTTLHWAPKKWHDEVPSNSYFLTKVLHDMEMHMFFYRTDLKSFEKAETHEGGLAVFNMRLSSGYDNPELMFHDLEINLHKVRSPNITAEIPPFRFLSFLDYGQVPFLYYEGSLDYPPCSESVSWFLFDSGLAITDGLIHELRKIKLAEGDVSNVRPTQVTNGREIQYLYNHKGNEEFEKLLATEP